MVARMFLSSTLAIAVTALEVATLCRALGVDVDPSASRFILKSSNPREERRHKTPASDPPISSLNNSILFF